MSYSALTDLGERPKCPKCGKTIGADAEIVLLLASETRIDRNYNEENELPVGNVTVDLDWKEQVAYHRQCVVELIDGKSNDD